MQLYIADYLADTRCLTTEQHGTYLLLLMSMWRHGGSLPSDPKTLARIAGVSFRRWHLVAEAVMPFFDVRGSVITQSRLVREYEKALSKSEKRSASGKVGGDAKALKDKEAYLANAKRSSQHSLEPDIREDTDVSSKRARETADTFDGWWERYPEKVAKRTAEKAYAAALKRGASPDDLASGLERYIATKRPDQSWCHPTTWLNGNRWADEPAPSPSRTLNGGRNGFGNRTSFADTTRAIFDEIDRQRSKPRAIEHDGPSFDGIAERRG